jgi:hypothetical protein
VIAHSTAVPVLNRYEVNEVTGCWLWLGYTDKNGYARVNSQNAHRVFFVEHVGPVPDGFDVDHLCKRRDCVNPAHLESVTEQENILRITRTVTYQGRSFEICRNGHPLTGDNLRLHNRVDRSEKRRGCAVCARAQGRATYAAAHPDSVPRNFSVPRTA